MSLQYIKHCSFRPVRSAGRSRSCSCSCCPVTVSQQLRALLAKRIRFGSWPPFAAFFLFSLFHTMAIFRDFYWEEISGFFLRVLWQMWAIWGSYKTCSIPNWSCSCGGLDICALFVSQEPGTSISGLRELWHKPGPAATATPTCHFLPARSVSQVSRPSCILSNISCSHRKSKDFGIPTNRIFLRRSLAARDHWKSGTAGGMCARAS